MTDHARQFPETMCQPRLYAPGDLRIDEVPVPPPVEDEVTIRMRRCLITGTDLKFFGGDLRPGAYPTGIGGSAVGEVVAVGPAVTRFATGDRVIASGPGGCGKCPRCRRGQGNYCMAGRQPMRRRGECFAEYVTLPEFRMRRVPDGLTDEHAATMNPVTLALHVHSVLRYGPGDRVVVVGAGPVGWSQIKLVGLQGARCLTLEPRPERRAVALKLGAEVALDPHADGSFDAVRDWCDGVVEMVVDAVATQAAQEMIFDLVAPGGSVALTGATPWSLPIQWIVHRSLRVAGFRGGINPDEGARLIASGDMDLTPLITHRFALGELPAAYARMRRGDPEILCALLVG